RQPLFPLPGERRTLCWVGHLQVSGFLICSIIGLSILPAGRAIVLSYTMPLWAVPIGLFLWPEPMGRGQLIGAIIGFAGLVPCITPSLADWSSPRILGGNAMLLLAAVLWAVGSCLYRRVAWRTPFWSQIFWQLAVSVVPVGALVALRWETGPVLWSPRLIA